MGEKLVRLMIVLCHLSLGVFSQPKNIKQNLEISDYPQVGRACPDFQIRNISYFPKKEAALTDFNGKWLVIDFWNKHCGACVASFPKTSQLQKIFGEQVQFMLVGIQDSDGEMETIYNKFRKRFKLALPCAFDSSLAKRFDIGPCPYIIVIDKEGIVQAITTSIDSNAVASLLKGDHPNLFTALRKHQDNTDGYTIPYDPARPYLILGNGGIDSEYLFRSVLTQWNASRHKVYIPNGIDETLKEGRFQILGADLQRLYRFAFFGRDNIVDDFNYGKYYPTLILEVRDPAKFSYSYVESKNIYSYSLSVPQKIATPLRFKEMMQADLKNYFGFNAKVEDRLCSCWKLVSTPKGRKLLPSKGGTVYFKQVPHVHVESRNWPFAEFLSLIRRCTDDIVLDETGIQSNIDMSMDFIDTDFDDLKKALNSLGLDLVKAKRTMKVLVITD